MGAGTGGVTVDGTRPIVRPPYRVAFLVPATAKAVLRDGGWEFLTKSRISDEVEFAIRTSVLRDQTEPNLERYVSESMEVDIEKDDDDTILLIDFRFYGQAPYLPVFLKDEGFMENLRFFIPGNASEDEYDLAGFSAREVP